MKSRKIRVLIVDSGNVSRNELVRQLEWSQDIEVIGQTAHRRQAIRIVQELKPDLLLLTCDLASDEHAGMVETIETVMAIRALPIMVMPFGECEEREGEFISRGALAVFAHQGYSEQATQALHRQVEVLAGVKVIRHLRGLHGAPVEPPRGLSPLTSSNSTTAAEWPFVLAIACSTGGPQALSQLLPAFPGQFPCPVIIAQHIAEGFSVSMADWLDSLTELNVQLAKVGDHLEAGRVYILPAEQHLQVSRDHGFVGVDCRESDVYHPSCDLLLSSVAEVYREKAVGLIMTGMGSDGCEGMAAIFRYGGKTLAQDEHSSVVFGMNKQAIDRGSIHFVLPLNELANEIIKMSSHDCRETPLL